MRKILVLLIFGLGLVSWLRAAPGPVTIEALPITVSATVAPQISDFPITFTSTTSDQVEIGKNTQIDYTLTYGSYVYYATNPRIEVVWNQGELPTSPVQYSDILEYVSGSAITAYPNGSPVVDLENRKITWSITGFPKRTFDKTLTFSLKTNTSNAGNGKIKLNISARLIAGKVITPDITLVQYYKNNDAVVINPTPTPSPSPTPIAHPGVITLTVAIANLTQDQAKINIGVLPASNIQFNYGLSPSELTEVISSAIPTRTHEIMLDKLMPATSYYFQVTASAGSLSKTSEIFTFKTAEISQSPQVVPTSLVVTSQEAILLSSETNPSLVIPNDTTYKFSFSLNKYQAIKSVVAVIRGKYVQGINSINDARANEQTVDLIQSRQGTYVGELASPKDTGDYQLIAIITDYQGNKNEQRILDLVSSRPMSIFRAGSTTPVESARVLFSIWDDKTGVFKPLPPRSIIKLNPLYSKPDGTIPISLPNGRYLAQIMAVGYLDQEIDFILGPKTYPIVNLIPTAFSIGNYLKYHTETSIDGLHSSAFIIRQLSQSSRFFDLASTVTIIIMIIVSLLTYSLHSRIPLWEIPEYFYFKLIKVWKIGQHQLLVSGRVWHSQTQMPLAKVSIYVIDPVNNHIVSHLTSNRFGEFIFRRRPQENLRIMAVKKGYIPWPTQEFSPEALALGPLSIHLRPYETKSNRFRFLTLIGDHLLEIIFESSLVISLLLELMFAYTLGIIRAAPFILVSCINLIFWIISDVVIVTKYEQNLVDTHPSADIV